MKRSASRSAAVAMSDLTALAANIQFRQAIKELKRDPAGLMDVCDDFWLHDIEWLKRVVRDWDGRGPLTMPEAIRDVSKMYDRTEGVSSRPFRKKPLVIAWHDAESLCPDGSPRTLWQRIVQPDALGTLWLRLEVRVTPDLSERDVKQLATDSLRWARNKWEQERPHYGRTKPNLSNLAQSFLIQMPTGWTAYKRATLLIKCFEAQGLKLPRSTAKAYERVGRKKTQRQS